MSWTDGSEWRNFGRDVLLTITGLVLVVVQSFQAHPKDVVIAAGLALTGIGATFHIGSIASARFGSGSGASQPPSPSSAHGSSEANRGDSNQPDKDPR